MRTCIRYNTYDLEIGTIEIIPSSIHPSSLVCTVFTLHTEGSHGATKLTRTHVCLRSKLSNRLRSAGTVLYENANVKQTFALC